MLQNLLPVLQGAFVILTSDPAQISVLLSTLSIIFDFILVYIPASADSVWDILRFLDYLAFVSHSC